LITTSFRRRLAGSARSTLIATSILVSACSGLTRLGPPKDASHAGPANFPAEIRWFGQTQRDFRSRATHLLGVAKASNPAGPMNILVLSGGGAGGAFGAGALVGWSRLGTRPQFQVVAGASVGALMAPLAFLGSGWDGQLIDAFSGNQTKHLLRLRWINAIFGVSLSGSSALRRLVDRYVTAELVNAVANEARKGRLLLVCTTDLDTEQTVFWNLGLIAEQGGDSARRLFREVLLASASIPGVFPPVMISVTQDGKRYDEMHVDGSTLISLPFLPDIAAIVPGRIPALDGARMYILVNSQTREPTLSIRVRTLPIFTRGATATLLGGTRGAIAIADFVAHEQDMSLAVSGIPNAYPFAGGLNFDTVKMSELFWYAERCAQANRLWGDPLTLLDQPDTTSDRRGAIECSGTEALAAQPAP
jgi:hypothetical protein